MLIDCPGVSARVSVDMAANTVQCDGARRAARQLGVVTLAQGGKAQRARSPR
jgi:hypothetical protein